MKDEILVSKLDYSRLNSMILKMLDTNKPNIYELNRLNMEIKRAKLVDPRNITPEVVTMNSVLRIKFPGTGTTRILRLVYPRVANMKDGSISILSPLGCALLGCRTGQTITFKSPGGSQTIIIDQILYQPEANGIDLK